MNSKLTQLYIFLIICISSINVLAQPYVNGLVKTGLNTLSNVANPTVGYQWSECAYDAPGTTYASTSAGFNGSKLDAAGLGGFRLGDDLVIPNVPTGVKWNITSLEFLIYQTGYAGVASPVNEVYVQIWDGNPSLPTSSVIFGNMTTNFLLL